MSDNLDLFNETIKSIAEITAPLCDCGCSLPVKWSEYEERWNLFIHGHNGKNVDNRREIYQDIDMILNRIAEFIGQKSWQMTLL